MHESHPPDRPRRVIIVDDKALVTKFLRMALQSVGAYSRTVTEDVPELLKEIEAPARSMWSFSMSPSATRSGKGNSSTASNSAKS